MKNDGVDSSICDDIRNDWLARELREENYHGCMDHDGAHAEGRANDRGWAARSAMREGYRECAPHEKQHFAQRNPKQPQQKPQKTQAQQGRMWLSILIGLTILILWLGSATIGGLTLSTILG